VIEGSARTTKMKRVSVSVQNDYLERMSKTRPINAVAELVWNSLDADADKIKVKLFENEMGGLEKLTVTDNGHGLDYALAEQAFGSLGGSWKKKERKTRGKKRFLHGRQGKGRFSAFALGKPSSGNQSLRPTGSQRSFLYSENVTPSEHLKSATKNRCRRLRQAGEQTGGDSLPE
jgi:Histidine kinase-, DNA gyrase B-, and HSP90-like ATPase